MPSLASKTVLLKDGLECTRAKQRYLFLGLWLALRLESQTCSSFSVPSITEEFEVPNKALFQAVRKNVWIF